MQPAFRVLTKENDEIENNIKIFNLSNFTFSVSFLSDKFRSR